MKLREVLIDTNTFHRSDLSLDLGAIAGLLFEIGSQKLVLGGDEYLSEPERKKLEQLIEGRPEILIHNGKLFEDTMKKSQITHQELNAVLHQAGCSEIKEVHTAILEASGIISVVPINR